MLDQSFSAHNLEVIFDLENRKGNIDINWMPEEYRAAAAEMKELRNNGDLLGRNLRPHIVKSCHRRINCPISQ